MGVCFCLPDEERGGGCAGGGGPAPRVPSRAHGRVLRRRLRCTGNGLNHPPSIATFALMCTLCSRRHAGE